MFFSVLVCFVLFFYFLVCSVLFCSILSIQKYLVMMVIIIDTGGE